MKRLVLPQPRIMFLIFILAVLFLVAYLYSQPSRERKSNSEIISTTIEDMTPLSAASSSQALLGRETARLSLFVGTTYALTLAVPVEWEGHYRVRDGANRAEIFFLSRGQSWPLLELSLGSKGNKLAEKGGQNIYFKVHERINSPLLDRDEYYERIRQELPAVLGTWR